MFLEANSFRDPRGPAPTRKPFARFLSAVFLTMAGGVIVTAAAAEAVAHDSGLRAMLVTAGELTLFGWVTLVAPICLVLLISGGMDRLTSGVARTLFLIYAVLVGLSLGTVFEFYAGANIAGAFIGAAAGFASLAFYGLATRRELSRMGSFLTIALIGLVVALFINIFTASAGFDAVLAMVGAMVFAGLTAWDMQKLKCLHAEGASDRVAVIGALTLYLDLLNLFLSLLRLTRRRR